MHPTRPSFLSPLSCLALSVPVQAAQLSLRFAGGGNEVELAASDTVTLEVVWVMAATDTSKSGAKLTGLELRLGVHDAEGQPLEEGLTVESVGGVAGWDLSATEGVGQPLSESGSFLSVIDPSGVGIAGNGTSFETVVASIVLRSEGGLGDILITIRHHSPGDPLPTAYRGASAWSLKWQEEVTAANEFYLGEGNPGDEGPQWNRTTDTKPFSSSPYAGPGRNSALGAATCRRRPSNSWESMEDSGSILSPRSIRRAAKWSHFTANR